MTCSIHGPTLLAGERTVAAGGWRLASNGLRVATGGRAGSGDTRLALAAIAYKRPDPAKLQPNPAKFRPYCLHCDKTKPEETVTEKTRMVRSILLHGEPLWGYPGNRLNYFLP